MVVQDSHKQIPDDSPDDYLCDVFLSAYNYLQASINQIEANIKLQNYIIRIQFILMFLPTFIDMINVIEAYARLFIIADRSRALCRPVFVLKTRFAVFFTSATTPTVWFSSC